MPKFRIKISGYLEAEVTNKKDMDDVAQEAIILLESHYTELNPEDSLFLNFTEGSATLGVTK